MSAIFLSVAGLAAAETERRNSQPAIHDKLSPETAIEFAWHHHPIMASARAQVAAQHGREVQAALWPRPELGALLIEEDEKTERQLSIYQKLELGGKRSARVSVAAASAFLSETDRADAWRNLRAEIIEAFARLAYVRELVEVTGELERIGEEQAQLAAALLKAGKLSEQVLLKTKQRSALAAAASDNAGKLLKDAERQVLIAMGAPADSPMPGEIDCNRSGSDEALPAFKELLQLAFTNNPAMTASRARVMIADSLHRVARASRWSDVTLTAGYKSISKEEGLDSTATIAGLSMGLPIWDRSQGDIAATRELSLSEKSAQELTMLDVAALVSKLHAEYEGRVRDEKTLAAEVLPIAEKRYALIRNRHDNGKIGKGELLRAQAELEETMLEHARAKLMLAIATAEIEKAALGAAIPGENASDRQ